MSLRAETILSSLRIGPTSARDLQWELEGFESVVPLPSIRRSIGELRDAGWDINVQWDAGFPEYVLST